MRFGTAMAVIALTAIGAPAHAQAQRDTEAWITEIRAAYGAVQSGLEGFQQAEKVYYFGDGEGLVTTFSDAGAIRKIVVEFHRDGFSGLYEYFFAGDNLFFAFTKGETFQIWPDQDPSEFGVTENRYYFANEALIRWLQKPHTEGGRQREVPPSDADYSSEAAMVLEDAHKWRDYARSDIEDYEAFLDSRRNR